MIKVNRYQPFSSLLEDIIMKNKLRSIYIQDRTLQMAVVDIVMPTLNRASLLDDSIKSVKNQLHQSWNLFICDDGSTDDTERVCSKYLKDTRINYIKLPHRGVSSARNHGILCSKNEYISFLDSDNTWNPEYLSLMVTFMEFFSLESAFCAARLIGDCDEQWLGDYFSWELCAEMNYIDLNCFMFKPKGSDHVFDESLQRLVDWDFILNVTKEAKTSYLPSPLVRYCNRKSRKRISTTVKQSEKQILSIQNRYLAEGNSSKNTDARLNFSQK